MSAAEPADPPTASAGGASSPAAAPPAGGGDDLHATYGVHVVYAGLAVVLVAFVVAVIVYSSNPGDVSTALAPVTGVVGTIVGAYFGVQVGSQGKETAERRADQRVQRADARTRDAVIARDTAESHARIMAAVAPAGVAAKALGIDLDAPTAAAGGAEAPSERRLNLGDGDF